MNLLRVVKSPEELVYVQKAAELADEALDEAHRLVKNGCDEAENSWRLCKVQYFSGGGDYPSNEFIIGSGGKRLALPLLFWKTKTEFRKTRLLWSGAGVLSPLPRSDDAHNSSWSE